MFRSNYRCNHKHVPLWEEGAEDRPKGPAVRRDSKRIHRATTALRV